MADSDSANPGPVDETPPGSDVLVIDPKDVEHAQRLQQVDISFGLTAVPIADHIDTPVIRQANALVRELDALKKQVIARYCPKPVLCWSTLMLLAGGLVEFASADAGWWTYLVRMIVALAAASGASAWASYTISARQKEHALCRQKIEDRCKELIISEQFSTEKNVRMFFARLNEKFLKGWDNTMIILSVRLLEGGPTADQIKECDERVKVIRAEIDRFQKLFSGKDRLDLSIQSTRMAVDDKIAEILGAIKDLLAKFPTLKKYLGLPDDLWGVFLETPDEDDEEIEPPLVKIGDKSKT